MVGLYSYCMRRTSSQCIMHRVQGCAITGSKVSGMVDKAPWCWRIFIKQIRYISKNKHYSLWSSSPTSELSIILRRRRQVLSTVDDHSLSITLIVQLCAQHDDDWVRWTRCVVHQSQPKLVFRILDTSVNKQHSCKMINWLSFFYYDNNEPTIEFTHIHTQYR